MTPPLLCRCSHPRSAHAAGDGLEPCKPSCGCLEWRLDVRSRIRDEGSEDEGAATREAS
jgi:hypothetical protein